MFANTKIANFVNREEDLVDKVVFDLESTSRLLSAKSLFYCFIVLELIPLIISFARGLSSPFFAPATINPHVYHHIHFLVYGFPVGFLVWFIMNRRVRELERRLARVSPLNFQPVTPIKARRVADWLPQLTLFIVFWVGWDDLKYHYLSCHWSLIHELLVWLHR